jgi:hypothetical protein
MLDGPRLGPEILPNLSVQRNKELCREKDKRNRSKQFRQEGAHRLKEVYATTQRLKGESHAENNQHDHLRKGKFTSR